MSELVLAINKVSYAYGSKAVFDSLQAEFATGHAVGLIGSNGVGKTTLIKIMLGLAHASQGQVLCAGADVNEAQSRKLMAYLPEKFLPSPLLKGREFLEISLSFYKKTYQHEVAKQKAFELGLDPEILNAKIKSYSKGMAQKLGLMSVFLTECPFVILDEPMSGLDPQARIQVKQLIRQYVDAGNTVFFSSHILYDVHALCDRMLVLHNGEFIFDGTPASFTDNYPAHDIEASFLKAVAG